MPTTPAERKALLFLGAVAVLGVGVRVVGHLRGDRPAVAGMQPALERQLARAEAQARLDRAAREAREAREKGGAGKRRAGSRGRRDSSGTASGGAARAAPGKSVPPAPPPVPAIVDVDRADTLALATLPGVGPALARRIVEDRIAHGDFGGLAALDGVSGVGPALLQRLAPRVTFSGRPRPLFGQGKPGIQGRQSGAGGRRHRRAGAGR